ncbi:MAG TPA: nucleotidyltransferase domain-containing protein [Puia sp.]|nr:nucleotidyltransferase domain-containing protein [Puia sp.]
MREAIDQQIRDIERNNQVVVLFACESGSRAWGFASPDSDYDVRFIYAQPLNNYISIRERKDSIELPVNEVLDVNGWDIRKALQLFLKSNATLYEWLQSPIVYKEKSNFSQELRDLMPSFFSHRAGCHHYLAMARNTFENDLQGEQVKLKKYFYALRPLLACLWIIENRSVPPMEFGKLRTLVTDQNWNEAVDRLLEQKKVANEKDFISPVTSLQQWIEKTVVYCKEQSDAIEPVKHDIALLDVLFRKYIGNHDL